MQELINKRSDHVCSYRDKKSENQCITEEPPIVKSVVLLRNQRNLYNHII